MLINILLIENDEFDLESTSRKIKYNSAVGNVMHFTNGNTAIDYFFKSGKYTNIANHILPHLIMIDLSLTHYTGDAILKTIKENGNEEIQSIPILIVATNANHPLKLACFNLGANGFLNKPIDANYFTDFLIKFGLHK